jgi:hypothetical protein
LVEVELDLHDKDKVKTEMCTQVDQQPSQPGPYYYTCNKYGMYGMAERVEPFIYPPCAGKSNIYTSLFLPYLCHVSLILLLPNTDHLQQVKDYVRDFIEGGQYLVEVVQPLT